MAKTLLESLTARGQSLVDAMETQNYDQAKKRRKAKARAEGVDDDDDDDVASYAHGGLVKPASKVTSTHHDFSRVRALFRGGR